MENMDQVVVPKMNKVILNPNTPNIEK